MSVAQLIRHSYCQCEQDEGLPFDTGLFGLLDELTDLSDGDEEPPEKVRFRSVSQNQGVMHNSRSSAWKEKISLVNSCSQGIGMLTRVGDALQHLKACPIRLWDLAPQYHQMRPPSNGYQLW